MRCVAMLALALCAAPAAAQDARLTQRLAAPTAAAVRALVDSAAVLELPAEPLVQKALEGASKGARPDAIVGAVRGLLDDLVRARRALGGAVPASALQLAASALSAGATTDGLERLRAHRAKRGFSGALAGVVYLLSRGVSEDAAIGIVAGMLEAGLTNAEFASLQRLVEQDVRSGVPSAEAASLRARALIRYGRGIGAGGGPS
jgi:hypothetical protein